MIPIECPKCGRGGSVPPDRLNARLVCKACHTVFHLDNTGRMVLGEPESFDMKSTKERAERSAGPDFDLSQTLNDIPKPVRFGVPALVLAFLGYYFLAPEPGAPDYIGQAESIVRAVASDKKSTLVSYATTESADAAGQWFDVVQGEMKKSEIGSDVAVNPALFSGNAEKDNDITLLVVLNKAGSTTPPVTLTLPMKRTGKAWKFDGNKGLELAPKPGGSSKTSKR